MITVEKSDKKARWEELIEEQEKSGLSQREFCEKNNLILSKFGYHRGLIKAKDRSTVKNTKLFSPIQVKKNEPITLGEIRIVLPNGFQCFIPNHIDASNVKRLMEAYSPLLSSSCVGALGF